MSKKKQTSNQLEVQNAAKTLFANIRFMSPDSPIRTIVLTSSVPNEGKSTTSIELAKAIATAGNTVLLVEGDMRRRSLANILGVRCAAGLYAVLTDQVKLDAAVAGTTTSNLFFLDVEPSIPNPADIISSKRFRRLAAKLAESYDYVIYDMPPVGTFVDAAILSTLVDGTLLVVKPGGTKHEELMHAYEQLRKADANVIGAVATFCEGTGSEYYYAYYTESGKRVKDGGYGVESRALACGSAGTGGGAPVCTVQPASRRAAGHAAGAPASQAANRAVYRSAASGVGSNVPKRGRR